LLSPCAIMPSIIDYCLMTSAPFSLRPDIFSYEVSEAGVAMSRNITQCKLDQIPDGWSGHTLLPGPARIRSPSNPDGSGWGSSSPWRSELSKSGSNGLVWTRRHGSNPISPPNGIKHKSVRRSPEPSPFQMITGMEMRGTGLFPPTVLPVSQALLRLIPGL
jgi:hypothetical protein